LEACYHQDKLIFLESSVKFAIVFTPPEQLEEKNIYHIRAWVLAKTVKKYTFGNLRPIA
jgi:hypothetical protein